MISNQSAKKMSSVKQEVAAILMDYTDKIPEQDYIDILNRLGKIPDHKDPKKATEIQKELDEATNEQVWVGFEPVAVTLAAPTVHKKMPAPILPVTRCPIDIRERDPKL